MDRIAIMGLGLIGGSLAMSLRDRKAPWRILGVDVDPHALRLAKEAGAIEEGAHPDEAPFDACDLVVLATPAADLMEAILPVARRMRPGAVLTDVCGAKEAVCTRASQQDRVVFVGAHPMAGTEFRGFAAALPTLFQSATVAICPPVGPAEGYVGADAAVRALWLAAGAASLLDVDPATHDRAVTYASHLPYLAAAAVVEALRDASESELARALAAGGFRDTTRLAGDGTVSGAAALNRHVPTAARDLCRGLRALADELESQPARALERLGKLADERRRMKLPKPR
jgi:prephenate dehydrogenase